MNWPYRTAEEILHAAGFGPGTYELCPAIAEWKTVGSPGFVYESPDGRQVVEPGGAATHVYAVRREGGVWQIAARAIDRPRYMLERDGGYARSVLAEMGLSEEAIQEVKKVLGIKD